MSSFSVLQPLWAVVPLWQTTHIDDTSHMPTCRGFLNVLNNSYLWHGITVNLGVIVITILYTSAFVTWGSKLVLSILTVKIEIIKSYDRGSLNFGHSFLYWISCCKHNCDVVHKSRDDLAPRFLRRQCMQLEIFLAMMLSLMIHETSLVQHDIIWAS